jgi:hypothetical protein
MQVWSKTSSGTLPNLSITINGNETLTGKYTARSGDWMLYRFEISPKILAAYNGQTISIALSGDAGADDIYIDDVRFQPTEAEAMCYVYDKRYLRLIAQFDDQHFGRFYQYDYEGKLIRTQIETERGVKTLQENHYNTPDETR